MILGDLLGKPLRGPGGDARGVVVDARFRRSPRNGPHEGALELVALIVSPHSRLPMYGYERGRVTRPRVIAALVGWLHRGSCVVPWECVARVDADAVVLGVEPPHIPLDVRRPAEG